VAQVIWSPAALDDVDAIAAYIARDSPNRAAGFTARLLEATDKLIDHPLCGHVIPEIGHPDRREIFVGAYRILYRIDENIVRITRVIHGARQWFPE
jgi:toxin ParE1/3/4